MISNDEGTTWEYGGLLLQFAIQMRAFTKIEGGAK